MKYIQIFKKGITVIFVLIALVYSVYSISHLRNELSTTLLLGIILLGGVVGYFLHRTCVHKFSESKKVLFQILFVILLCGHTFFDGVMLGGAFSAGFGATLFFILVIASHEIPRVFLMVDIGKKMGIKIVFTIFLWFSALFFGYMTDNYIDHEVGDVILLVSLIAVVVEKLGHILSEKITKKLWA